MEERKRHRNIYVAYVKAIFSTCETYNEAPSMKLFNNGSDILPSEKVRYLFSCSFELRAFFISYELLCGAAPLGAHTHARDGGMVEHIT